MTTRQRLGALVARHGIFVGVLLLIVVFTAMNDRFLSTSNATTIGVQIAALGVLALPLAVLVIGGSVDLSVGSVVSITSIAAAKVMGPTDSIVLGLLAALAVGAAIGGINGILVGYLGLNAIVVTLGALSIWAGAALLWTDGGTLIDFPADFPSFGTAKVLGIPVQIYVLLFTAVVMWALLNQRPYGRELRAIGGSERAAFLMGLRVRRVRFLAFVIVGAAAALSGFLLTAQLQAATPTIGLGMEIQALTVVLLGGVAFTGGVGELRGVIAGLLFVGVLKNGLVIVGASGFLQQVLLGATLIGAVALDALLERQRARSVARMAIPPVSAEPGALAVETPRAGTP